MKVKIISTNTYPPLLNEIFGRYVSQIDNSVYKGYDLRKLNYALKKHQKYKIEQLNKEEKWREDLIKNNKCYHSFKVITKYTPQHLIDKQYICSKCGLNYMDYHWSRGQYWYTRGNGRWYNNESELIDDK